MDENQTQDRADTTVQGETKFCKECGQKIAKRAVICPHCGCQVEEMEKSQAAPQIVITNTNQNTNTNANANAGVPCGGRLRNKWVALLLCVFLGFVGGHKFYEGKAGMGILYLFTMGLFGIGVIIDFFTLLFKPNPYTVF